MSNADYSKFKHLLVDSNEQIHYILGNDLAESFLATGTIQHGFAVLSNKRVYFKGFCLIKSGKRFVRQLEERVVDLNDITGTGFVHDKNYGPLMGALMMFLSWLFLSGYSDTGAYSWLFLITGILLVIAFFMQQKTIFEISYAGGGIGFDVRWHSQNEPIVFQKILRQAKDIKKQEESNALLNVIAEQKKEAHQQSSDVDDIIKFKNLLDQGIITQEEFDAKKKQLLNI